MFARLRWLLARAVRSFGHRRISQLRPAEIAAWRMTIPAGHRFEAFEDATKLMARAMPGARVEWVEGGHLINPAHPAVLGFVDDVLARR